MQNQFYNNFDTATRGERKSDYRTPFQQDRDRIIHTAAFRRLQAKTQVFLSGEYDFYRTRLTHSIEVAQIGRSICYYLQHASPLLKQYFFIDPDLVEAVCLSHDIGHPPFGHAGERSLHHLLREYGGFEGNAQTLRIITETIYSSGGRRRGMDPSRAFTDGVLKYKTLLGESPEAKNHFLYDDQADCLGFVFDGQTFPEEFAPGKSRNAFRSIECQIMDWADDTAYSTNDLVDGINAGFVHVENIERWAGDQPLDSPGQAAIDAVINAIRAQSVEAFFSKQISTFIHAAKLKPCTNFMSDRTHRYAFELVIDPGVKQLQDLYKKLAIDLVFRSPQISQLEYKGDLILQRMLRALLENYVTAPNPRVVLLPQNLEQTVRSGDTPLPGKARLLADYVAGMTDVFALRTYRRLFEPHFGSIADLV